MESSDALEQVAQGNNPVIISGSVETTWKWHLVAQFSD